MEAAYPSASTAVSSSASSTSSSASMYLSQYSKEAKTTLMKPQQSFHSSLHAIRKPQVKPWKKPIAPLPPTPPRVYKVDPSNFRDVVQKLTGAPETQAQQRLQSIAPPPLDLVRPALFSRDVAAAAAAAAVAAPLQLLPSPAKTPLSAFYKELMSDSLLDAKPKKISDSSLEMNLSPSSYSWCSFPLLSPGTLSSLEQSTVL